MATQKNFLGYGLMRPFRRDGAKDFVHGGGLDLIESALGQTLGTRAASAISQGEMPWRPDAGSKLYLLKHRNNSETFREIARVYAREAIRNWEPRVGRMDVTAVEPQRINELNQAVIKVSWAPIERNRSGNQVITGNRVTEQEIV